ncbi:MAG: cupin domain-containing protein [Verrucomicrobiota bacterium]
MTSTEILHYSKGQSSSIQHLGPYALETLVSESEEITMTAYRVSIAPHSTTATSYHKYAEEIYYVLEGKGQAVLNNRPYRLHVGDFLRLPPGTKHSFTTGDNALVLLDIHSPGSRPNRDVYFEGKAPDGFSSS